MSYDEIMAIGKERYDVITGRYAEFIRNLSDVNKEPITVFDPLPPPLVQQLELIREVSKDLQMKKEDFVKKQAQAKLDEERAAAEKQPETEESKKEE